MAFNWNWGEGVISTALSSPPRHSSSAGPCWTACAIFLPSASSLWLPGFVSVGSGHLSFPPPSRPDSHSLSASVLSIKTEQQIIFHCMATPRGL